MSALEEELCVKAVTMKSIQNEMAQSKKELTARELSIQRARDELSLAHTRMAQESERVNMHTTTNINDGTTPTTTENKCVFIAVLIICIPLSPVVFVTEWVLASFVKTFLFDFHENDKHIGNILLKSQSVIIRNLKKVELEKYWESQFSH